MSAVSGLAGPRRSKARIAARSASRPIWAPAPSSPSVKPRPPMMVSFPLTRAIAAEPVPAITSPPSAPAWAPMHAVTASFAARTRRKPGNASTTRAASLGSSIPASPNPIAIRARSALVSPALAITSLTTARRTAIAAAKSTWIFAAAPLASTSSLPSASRSRARQRVAPPSTPRVSGAPVMPLSLERQPSPPPPL